MPISVDNLTPKQFQVVLVPAPNNPDPSALRQIFVDLQNFDFDSFAMASDGGATISNPRQQKSIVIGPLTRNVSLPVQTTLQRTVTDALELIKVIHTRLPLPVYFGCQINIISHLPVTGETAAQILDEHVFSNAKAFEPLGAGRIGTGIKVFLAGTGTSQVLVEPLLARNDHLFIQYLQVNQIQIEQQMLQGIAEAALRFQDNQIKQFIGSLFAPG